jgi:hypothetical protein
MLHAGGVTGTSGTAGRGFVRPVRHHHSTGRLLPRVPYPTPKNNYARLLIDYSMLSRHGQAWAYTIT